MKLAVAVLAGGQATRLRPLTERLPKAMVEVAGRPFIEWQLDRLRSGGARKVVLCLGFLGETVRAAVGDGARWGLDVRYSFDGPELLGTGGALKKALPLLGASFLVLHGDVYLDCDFSAVEEAFLASGRPALMTVFRNRNRWDRSNVLFSGGRIVRYDKRRPSPEMEHIDYGLGALHAGVFDAYPADRPVDLAGVYEDLLKRDGLAAWEASNRFYEIGSPAGLEELRRHLLEKGESDG